MAEEVKDKAYYEALDKRSAEYKEWKALQDTEEAESKDDKKEKKVKIDHSNPFNKGVTYKSFLKEIGDKDLDTHLKSLKLTDDSVKWLKEELKNYKNNK